MAGVAEATELSSRAAVDPRVMMNAISAGPAGSRVLQLKGPKMSGSGFSPGFRSVLHLKDLTIVLAKGAEVGLVAGGTEVAKRSFEILADSVTATAITPLSCSVSCTVPTASSR
jgi:2-hydroxy-3-oxopropionate reductase